jgi:integrase
LLLTGQRRDEVAGMRWREIDLKAKLWTIPEERFKSGVSHQVPLVPDMIAILETLPKSFDHLFSTTQGRKPVSGYSKAKQLLDQRMAPATRWTFHDLRRTCRTHLSALRVPDTVAEMVIGHGRKGLQRVYDQHQFADEMREALGLWAGQLRDIVTPAPANVIKIGAVR